MEHCVLVGVEDGVLPPRNCEDIEEERRVAYVGMTRARCRLGLTYSAERYGEKSRPSPLAIRESAAKGRKRHCVWTGPRSPGANERLPLTSASERQRLIGIPQGRYQGRTASLGRPVRPRASGNPGRLKGIDRRDPGKGGCHQCASRGRGFWRCFRNSSG